MSSMFMKIRWLSRSLLTLAFASLAVWESELNQLVKRLWANLRESWWFRLESFEPLVVVLFFSIFIFIFNFLDIFRFSWLKEFRIMPNRNPTKEVSTKHFFRWSAITKLVLYLSPIFAFDFFYPRRQLPVEIPSVLFLFWQIVATL